MILPPPPAKINVFLLYAREDVDVARALKRQMVGRERELIDPLEASQAGDVELEGSLDRLLAADVVVVLYSAFFTQDYRSEEGGGPTMHSVLFRWAWELWQRRELKMVFVRARHVHVVSDAPFEPHLVPEEPLASGGPAGLVVDEKQVERAAQHVSLTIRGIRREVQPLGRGREDTMRSQLALSVRPRSGELLLSQYRLVQRIRHDAWMSEWIAADEGGGADRGVNRTLIVHMFGLRCSGKENQPMRERVLDRVRRLYSDRLPGLGSIVEPRAAYNGHSFFIVEDTWRAFTTEFGAPMSLRAAVAQRRRGVHWMPTLLEVGRQLAALHGPKRDGRIVHGAVNPDNIVVDVPGGPVLVGLDLFAGERIWRPVLNPDPDDIAFLPPRQDTAAPPVLDVSSDLFGFAATVLHAALDGDVDPSLSWAEACDQIQEEGLRGVLRRALSEDSDERHRDVATFCEALRTAYLPIGESILPEMCAVPAGELWMGRSETDEIARPYEKPRRRVRVSAFWMSIDPVPQSLYQIIMGGNPMVRTWPQAAAATSVSFRDGVEFCNRLSRLRGFRPAYLVEGETVSWDRRADGFRIPTEAEWEYAASGGCAEDQEPRLYPWGDDEPKARACWSGPEHGHFTGNERGPCPPGRHEGGESPFGVRGMAGGVCEWCWDWYRPYAEIPAAEQPLIDPSGPPSCQGPKDYEVRPYRVLHGAMWSQRIAPRLRCSARYLEDQSKRQTEIGLRLVRGAIQIPDGEDPIVN